jgi:diaminopropionate ammonia-lyase
MGRMTSWYRSPAARDWNCPSSPGKAHAFHQSMPGYSPTPLVSVPELATELGIGRLLVKDEP